MEQKKPDSLSSAKDEIKLDSLLLVVIITAVLGTIGVSLYLNNFAESISSTKLNSSYQSGYAQAIQDTQNKTLLIGYCAAQQEVYTSGVLTANNTILVMPVTTLKEICFR